MNRASIDKIAQTPDDKLLLAKLWDKLRTGIQRNTPANTGFLSLREQDMAAYLFGNAEGLYAFGGYEDAERKLLVYLPEYLDIEELYGENSPVACIRAEFYHADTPNHRDFLGAMMGLGLTRQTVGDICVGDSSCDFFVTAEIAPFLLQNFDKAGRTPVRLSRIALHEAQIPQQEVKTIRDTIASVRLDSVLAAGFQISRSLASDHIAAGRVSVNGLPCEKSDKTVEEGAKISVRGLGKMRLSVIGGQSKKGRIFIQIDRYL